MKTQNYTKRSLACALIILLLIGHPVSAFEILTNTFEEIAQAISFGVVSVINTGSVLTAALIKANPCVWAGTSPTDECDIMGLPLRVDNTIRNINVSLIEAFMPLYITFFLILGLYMILMQGSPKGRAEAKAFFIDLVIGMVLVGLSPILFQIILNISSSISEYIWTQAGINIGTVNDLWATGSDTRTYCCFFWISLVSVLLSTITAGFRYFCVMIFAALFPLSLFLYNFKFTKGMGNTLMKFSFLAVFSQILMMLFLVVGLLAYSDHTLLGGAPAFRVLWGISAMTAIWCTPLIMLKVMHWIGGALYAYSSRGGGKGVRAISQLMRGRSASDALATAAGRYQTTHTLGMYERGGERMTTPGWSEIESGGSGYPGFPHSGPISPDGQIIGPGGRFGRLRSGLSIAGLGGGGLGGGGIGGSSPSGAGGSIGGVTPKASNRSRHPTHRQTGSSGQPGFGSSNDGEGAAEGGVAPSGGGSGFGGSGGGGGGADTGGQAGSGGKRPDINAAIAEYGRPSGGLNQAGRQGMIAYQRPDSQSIQEAEAEILGAEVAQTKEGADSRIGAINQWAANQKAFRRAQSQNKMLSLKPADLTPESEPPEDEEQDFAAPIPGFLRNPNKLRAPAKSNKDKDEKKEGTIEVPSWVREAQGMFANKNAAIKKISRVARSDSEGHVDNGRATKLINQVKQAKSGIHKDKSHDELLNMALAGQLHASQDLMTGGKPKKKKKEDKDS